MLWRKFANIVRDEYGMQVDEEEEFAICPECGEPIYKTDWRECDYTLGTLYHKEIYCPVCENLIWAEDEEAEEEDF